MIPEKENPKASKPNVRSKVLLFPTAQRERTHELFRQNRSYKEIQKLLKDEFGETISTSSLCNYYQSHAMEFMAPPKKKEPESSPNGAFSGISVHLHFHTHPPAMEGFRP